MVGTFSEKAEGEKHRRGAASAVALCSLKLRGPCTRRAVGFCFDTGKNIKKWKKTTSLLGCRSNNKNVQA